MRFVRARSRLAAAALGFGTFALAAGLPGCAGDGNTEVMPPVVLGLVDTAAPTYDDGQVQIYQVTREVRMPFRAPNEGERPQGRPDPYPNHPFQVTTDTRTTVRFTLSNLDDRQHTVELLIDPWNEFVRYQPGVTMDEEETIPNLSGIDRFFIVPPKGRVEGIITPDDMNELAIDLVTAMKLMATPPPAEGDFGGPSLFNRAFNIQNRSSEPDPVLAGWLPTGPIATVIGFDLGLRTYEQAKLAVELVIDIEDTNGERTIKSGEEGDRRIGIPGTVLTPPPPMRE